MKKPHCIRTAAGFGGFVFRLHAEPAELTSARANYQKQIKSLTGPVNARYIAFLESHAG